MFSLLKFKLNWSKLFRNLIEGAIDSVLKTCLLIEPESGNSYIIGGKLVPIKNGKQLSKLPRGMFGCWNVGSAFKYVFLRAVSSLNVFKRRRGNITVK